MMEGVKNFLESSTIHGLSYISITRRFTRVFWILVVITGFTIAGLLINESFKSWADSPIKTTIETRPMTEIKFPKATVCPPKNTYTDLNYDLMVADNVTMTEDMIRELFNYAYDVVDKHIFMDDINKFHEEDRYYNWYHGFTKIYRPRTDSEGLNYFIYTSSTSGVITTQYYGEKFQPHLVERKKLLYGIFVYPPMSLRNNTNVTLHFKLEKVSLTGISSGVEEISIKKHGTINAGITSASFNFSTGERNVWLKLSRRWVSQNDISKLEMDFMPGFRLSWYYTGMDSVVSPDSKYKNYIESLSFRRQVSLEISPSSIKDSTLLGLLCVW